MPRRTSPSDDHRPLEPEAVAARAAWQAAVRVWQEARTGRPSFYVPSPRLDGRTDVNGRRYRTPVWPKLVERAAACGVDPVAAVACLFTWWQGVELPEPADACGEENLRRLRDRIVRRPDEIRLAFRAESTLYRTRRHLIGRTRDAAAATLHVLSDPGIELSPLFRYAAALVAGLPDLAVAYLHDARRQYDDDAQLYRTHWAQLLTPAVRHGLGDPA